MNLLNRAKEFKSHLLKKEIIFNFILIISIFLLDRFSKSSIINNFNESTYYVNDFINFDLIWNTGIGFGLLSNNSILIYHLITALIGIVILFLVYIVIISQNAEKIIYSLVIGGAIGNFYDRVFFNAVPDFIDLHYNNFHWFTFNLADIFISVGVLILILRSFLLESRI